MRGTVVGKMRETMVEDGVHHYRHHRQGEGAMIPGMLIGEALIIKTM